MELELRPITFNNGVSLTRPVLLLACAAGLVVLGGFAMAGQPDFSLRGIDFVALGITGVTALVLVNFMVSRDGSGIVVDLGKPLNLFALFYLAYYVVGNWVSIFANAEARRNGVYMSLLTAAGLVCFIVGLRLVPFKETSDSFHLNASQRKALLIFAKITMGLLIWYYAWHISIGAFYTHVDYTVATTVFAGMMETAVAPLQLPLVLLLGLILRSSEGDESKKVKRLLFVYAALSVFVYAASSQFRPLAATLLFTIGSVNISQRHPVRLKAYFAAAALSGLMLTAILAVRSIAVTQDWSRSDNQLADSLSALSSDKPSDAEGVHRDTFNRMLNQQNLLSHIIDEISLGHPYVYGDLLFSSAYSLVPRAFWPSKPAVTPMQIMLRLEFDLPARDDAVGPLLEAYANGGWIAVTAAFLGLGILTAWITRRAAVKHSIASVLVICWWWSILAILEQELLLAILGGLRLIGLAAFLAWLLKGRFLGGARYYLKAIFAGAMVTLLFPLTLLSAKRTLFGLRSNSARRG